VGTGKLSSITGAGLNPGTLLQRQERPGADEGPVPPTERDIVFQIVQLEKPYDVSIFWDSRVKTDRDAWAGPLSELEQEYVKAYRDPSTPDVLRMRPPVDPLHLDTEELADSRKLFGTGPDAPQRYANYETRRRIVVNYVWKHPATVRLQLGLYRFVRDINPLHFALERGWQIGTGQEMFTGQDVSRLGAAGEFLLSLALIHGVGRTLKSVRPQPAPYGPPRPLTDPIYDLPQQGGGMRINGRWYTEHALERMAPDTPQIRAELRARSAARLERIGISPGNPAYDRALGKALGKIDPRGIPPSLVEAEIAYPGSTNIKVITANRGQIVVTVMPKR
jgi:hypothetical protein